MFKALEQIRVQKFRTHQLNEISRLTFSFIPQKIHSVTCVCKETKQVLYKIYFGFKSNIYCHKNHPVSVLYIDGKQMTIISPIDLNERNIIKNIIILLFSRITIYI